MRDEIRDQFFGHDPQTKIAPGTNSADKSSTQDKQYMLFADRILLYGRPGEKFATVWKEGVTAN